MSAKIYDTMLGEYIKNPGDRGLSLEKLSKKKLNYEMINFDNLVKKQKLKNILEVDLNLTMEYSAENVYIIHKLFCEQDLDTNEQKILNEIDFPLIKVLKNMELSGVKISKERLKELGNIFEIEANKYQNSIFEEVEEKFNINSPKQVGEILFDKLGLPKGKKTKTGWSVKAEVLEELAKKYNIANKIIKYRYFVKLNSTFVNGLLDLLDENNFLHTNYNQAITSTGRLSSTKPNLQNIPSSNGIAVEIRSAFISRFEGGKIMSFDYSQVELRLLAIMSEDESLLEAFKKGFDIHQRTAELIGTTDRKIAKAVNFGVVYGISGFGLSKMINTTVSDANLYIKKFFESYPKIKGYLDEIIKKCEETGYVETIYGRKRYIKGITDRNKLIKKSAEREAINMPVQGTSADIIKIAMIKINNFLNEKGNITTSSSGDYIENGSKKSKLIMQVHDEVVFDVYPGEEEMLKKEVTKIMENILVGKAIGLKVDCEIGNNWKEAK